MDLIYGIVIVASVLAILYFFIIKPFMEKSSHSPSIDNDEVTRIEHVIESESDSVDAPMTILPETEEEKIKRLNELVNPDEDKPFAKISKPDVSEMASAPEHTEKKRKKRSKKEDK